MNIWIRIADRFYSGWFLVFNTAFNNISVISWHSLLLVQETEVLGENHWPVASHWQTLSHNVISSTPRHDGPLDFSQNFTKWEKFFIVYFFRVYLHIVRLKKKDFIYCCSFFLEHLVIREKFDLELNPQWPPGRQTVTRFGIDRFHG